MNIEVPDTVDTTAETSATPINKEIE